MPARNGTGPLGLGPITGRGMGFCTGRNVGRHFGRGIMRRRYLNEYYQYADIQPIRTTAEDEKRMLKEEISLLKNDIEYMTKKLEELEAETKQY